MALQFAVSFGHVHVHGLGSARSGVIAAAPGSALAQTSRPAPAQHQSDDDDYCAICASIALLNNSFAAAPPQLPLPTVFHVVEHADRAAAAVFVLRRTQFQSRAPPAA